MLRSVTQGGTLGAIKPAMKGTSRFNLSSFTTARLSRFEVDADGNEQRKLKRIECGRLRNVFCLINGNILVAVLFNHGLRRSDFYNFSVFQDGTARTELANKRELVTCKNQNI